MDYIRKTARYNGKKYEATGKTELEALQKLADKLAAAKRGEYGMLPHDILPELGALFAENQR